MNSNRRVPSIQGAKAALRAFVRLHRVWSAAIAVAMLFGGYQIYGNLTAPSTATRYVTTTVATGTVVAALSETGQVSASHQLSLSPKASGQIVAIYVHPGQTVGAGQLLVALDAADAQTALTDAKLSLETAKLTYDQDTASSTLALALLQAQNGVTNAGTSLQQAHDDAYASIASIYTDLSAVLTGVDSALHDEMVAGHTNQENIDAFGDIAGTHDGSIGVFKGSAETSYDAAVAAYDAAVISYKATPRSASDVELVALADTTYKTAEAVADSVKDAHDFYDRVNNDYTIYNLGISSTLSGLLSSVQGYTTTVNADLSGALSDKTDIVSAEQSLAVAQNALDANRGGGSALAVQSAALTLKKAEEAVASAEQTLSDYYVRAPFAGVVASVPVQLYDEASPGTAVATLVTPQETVDLSVNEIDASKIEVGQKATISFDALPDVTIAGTVASVNAIGTVSQGVVSYDAVIVFDTENVRVKPGMSATADIVIGTQTGLIVPSSAIKSAGGASVVQVFDPPLAGSEGASGAPAHAPPTSIPVATGLSDDTHVVVELGLSAGDQIVTRTIAGTGASASATAPSAASLLRPAGTGGARSGGGGAVFIRGGG